jgi:hypothetical protein
MGRYTPRITDRFYTLTPYNIIQSTTENLQPTPGNAVWHLQRLTGGRGDGMGGTTR